MYVMLRLVVHNAHAAPATYAPDDPASVLVVIQAHAHVRSVQMHAKYACATWFHYPQIRPRDPPSHHCRQGQITNNAQPLCWIIHRASPTHPYPGLPLALPAADATPPAVANLAGTLTQANF